MHKYVHCAIKIPGFFRVKPGDITGLKIFNIIYTFLWDCRELPKGIEEFPAGDASLVIFLYCHSLVVM
jgi:hypothetical protein